MATDAKKPNRKLRCGFVSIRFSTQETPDGFDLVCAAARATGMKVGTYIRSATLRAVYEDLAVHAEARKKMKRPA